MSRQDELIAMSAQKALQSVAADAEATQRAYHQAIQSGDTENAAWQMRSYAALVEEANRITAAMSAGQQQPQQQNPNELTPVEIGFLQANPQYQDPRKFHEILASHYALVNRGMDRNSPEYASALNMSAGNPIPTPDKKLDANEVCEITGIDADTYNRNAADLLTLKSMGYYRDGR